jgi:serine/threonine-protein kinase
LPVIARQDTWSYRSSKFIRRNQIAVGAGMLVLLALLGGVVATAWEAHATRQEKARAESINAFLERVTETLDLYRQNFGTHYDNYPTALITQGLIWDKAGKSQESEAILREAVRLRTNSLPKEHFWVALANGALGEFLTNQGRYDEAEPLLLESYENLKSSQGTNNPRTRLALKRLVALYEASGNSGAAEKYRALLRHT